MALKQFNSLFTGISIFPSNNDKSLAYGSLQLGDAVWIDFQLKEGPKGKWLALPSYKKSDGTYRKEVVFSQPKEGEEGINFYYEALNYVEHHFDLQVKNPKPKAAMPTEQEEVTPF
jgi:DNA-binding cell septation regulator SpoVG